MSLELIPPALDLVEERTAVITRTERLFSAGVALAHYLRDEFHFQPKDEEVYHLKLPPIVFPRKTYQHANHEDLISHMEGCEFMLEYRDGEEVNFSSWPELKTPAGVSVSRFPLAFGHSSSDSRYAPHRVTTISGQEVDAYNGRGYYDVETFPAGRDNDDGEQDYFTFVQLPPAGLTWRMARYHNYKADLLEGHLQEAARHLNDPWLNPRP